MSNVILISSIFLVVLFFWSPCRAFDCAHVTTVESEGLLNNLINVSFTAPHNFSGQWVVDIETDTHFTFLGGWGVWVRSEPEKGQATFLSRAEDLEIQEGETVTFRFRISWFRGEHRPEVISIVWDGDQVCNDDGKTIKEIKASRARRTSHSQRIASGRLMRLPVN